MARRGRLIQIKIDPPISAGVMEAGSAVWAGARAPVLSRRRSTSYEEKAGFGQ